MIFKRRSDYENGGSAMEYVVIIALISFSLIAVVTNVGGYLGDVYCHVGQAIAGTQTCSSDGGGTDPGGSTDPGDDGGGTDQVGPNLPYPWIPPSWITTTTGTPDQVRRGLAGEEPGITREKSWQYGGDSSGPWPFGATRVKVVGDNTTGFSYEVVTDCVVNPVYGETKGCSNAAGWQGKAYSTNIYTIAIAYFADGTHKSISIVNGHVATSYLSPFNSAITVVFTGADSTNPVYSNAFLVTSTLTVSPQLTTQLVCQSLSTWGTQQMVDVTASGSAPAVTCPSGWVPVGIVVNGDLNMLNGEVASASLADYIAYYADYSSFHLEDGTGGCKLTNGAGVEYPLATSDCDDARSSGLL